MLACCCTSRRCTTTRTCHCERDQNPLGRMQWVQVQGLTTGVVVGVSDDSAASAAVGVAAGVGVIRALQAHHDSGHFAWTVQSHMPSSARCVQGTGRPLPGYEWPVYPSGASWHNPRTAGSAASIAASRSEGW